MPSPGLSRPVLELLEFFSEDRLWGSLTLSPLKNTIMFFLFQDPESSENEVTNPAAEDGGGIDLAGLVDQVKDFAIEKGPGVIGALVTLIIGLWVCGCSSGRKRVRHSRRNIERTSTEKMGCSTVRSWMPEGWPS